RIEAGRAVGAEMDVNPPLFDAGSARRIAVPFDAILRSRKVKNEEAVEVLAAVEIEADCIELRWLIDGGWLAVLRFGSSPGFEGRSIGEPNLVLPDDG